MTRTTSDGTVLTDRLGGMTADETVKLVRELCAQLGGGERFHGGVWPGNVFLDEEGFARLGPPMDEPVPGRTAEQVEFVAPEFFWESAGSAAADVYSLGLILYAGCRGVMPFQPESGPVTDKDRAAALQKRMKGAEIDAPDGVSPELGAVIKKALAYEPEERYATAAALLRALGETDEALPLSDAAVLEPVPPAAPDGADKPGGGAQERPVRKYTVQKDFEKNLPPPIRRRRRRFSPAVAILCVVAVAASGAAAWVLLRDESGQPEAQATPPTVSAPYILPADGGAEETADGQTPADAVVPSLDDEQDSVQPDEENGGESGEEEPAPTEPAAATEPPAASDDSPEAVGTLVVTSKVNLRAGPGTDFEILGVADVGQRLQTSAVTADGKWYRVSYNGAQAYVNRRLVSVRDFASVSAESGQVRVVSAANIRSGPSTDYEVLGKAAVGDQLTVTGRTDSGWYQLLYNGATAYIAGNLVEKS